MNNRNYERSLPGGYRLVKKMDAADFGFGLLLTFGSLVLFALCAGLVALPLVFDQKGLLSIDVDRWIFIMVIYLVITLVYMILHELTHGVAYKSMTGERLTFGIKWNCAYCGVPNILTYRKTSLVALYAPFTVFNIIFIPALVWAWFFSVEAYVIIGLVLATHISGCIGDLYMGHILLTKYKDKTTLLNDTGPCVCVFTFDASNIGKTDAKTESFKRSFEKRS